MTAEARPIAGEPNNKERRDLQLAEARSYLERLGVPGEKFRRSSKFGDKLDSSTSGQLCDGSLTAGFGDKFDRQGILNSLFPFY